MTVHPSRRKLAGHGDGQVGAPYLQHPLPLAIVNKANLRRPRRKLA
jgi:hypothetical protein